MSINEKKKTCRLTDFAVPANHRVKIKDSEKINKYLDFAEDFKKSWGHESKGNLSCSWYGWNAPQRHGQGTIAIGNQRKNQDHPDNSIVEIGQNIQNNRGLFYD